MTPSERFRELRLWMVVALLVAVALMVAESVTLTSSLAGWGDLGLRLMLLGVVEAAPAYNILRLAASLT